MKPISSDKASTKRNNYQSEDDGVRYKINTQYFNNPGKSPKTIKSQDKAKADEDDNIRYKFPTVLEKSKPADRKLKPKTKIKVNFWSTKQPIVKLHDTITNREKTNRRHTIAVPSTESSKPKNSVVKVRKQVSFLPSPLFSDNHVPMVTVPDDLTIQLNEEEANDLGEDLNHAFVNFASNSIGKTSNPPKRKAVPVTQTSPKGSKRIRNIDESSTRLPGNEYELEFFSKYVVQKLRKMETNQRIYSENLINTVLMLGQLGQLSGKSKITDA